MASPKEVQDLFQRYQREGHTLPVTVHDLASWAYDNGYCALSRSSIVARLAREFGRAMRADCHINPQGVMVRTKHVVTYKMEGRQIPLWSDTDHATQEHMRLSFQQRLKNIADCCKRLKTDVTSFNAHVKTAAQLLLNFSFDV
jgi:hypothetical protein